jgi:hypothetical protein
MPKFTWSDAWLLLSIAMSDDGSGASLKSIIAVGDWMNHAIFTGPELRRGLAKLLHVRYVTNVEGRFALAGNAKAYWTTCKDTRKSTLTRIKDFERFLKITDDSAVSPMFEDPEWRFSGITDEMVAHAYQEYIGKSHHLKKKQGKT